MSKEQIMTCDASAAVSTGALHWKPLKRRLFVFSVPEREKFDGSVLYRPNSRYRSLEFIQDCWICGIGFECRYPWQIGQHILIEDGLELEPVDLDLWETYKDMPEFAGLKSLVDRVGGKVETSIVSEASVLADTEGSEFVTGRNIHC